ncbi:Histone-lysine N-methyltransferase SETD2 [Heterocephalus glaber]|uniref:Histone-lysine N-methyltransferase SETD2 n=1 Tax=Heterocephalus glaber TaxID=10181 RepID=G5B1V2_HETGA|nr:Histone-lysine N-methyltransferase SETD2 [Heterocephalus glaber]
MDLGTTTYDENPMKTTKKPKTAEADTSSELAKKSKEVFRKEMSQFIVQCLNPYRKSDCKVGRITTTEDFKHLAQKLTHGVMNKELKYCKNPEDLECNENVKQNQGVHKEVHAEVWGCLQTQRGHGVRVTSGARVRGRLIRQASLGEEIPWASVPPPPSGCATDDTSPWEPKPAGVT